MASRCIEQPVVYRSNAERGRVKYPPVQFFHCAKSTITHENVPFPCNDGAMEAPAQVQGMFARIAGRYDLANALLSGGMDWFWRRRAAADRARVASGQAARPGHGQRRAGGDAGASVPGDDGSSARIFVCRCSNGRRRAGGCERLVAADAMRLPFADGAFDAVTVAFGLRNMASYAGALREMRRVLRAGRTPADSGFFRAARLVARSLPLLSAPLPAAGGGRGVGRARGLRVPGGIHRTVPARRRRCCAAGGCGFDEACAEELTGGIVSLYTASGSGHSIQLRILY